MDSRAFKRNAGKQIASLYRDRPRFVDIAGARFFSEKPALPRDTHSVVVITFLRVGIVVHNVTSRVPCGRTDVVI